MITFTKEHYYDTTFFRPRDTWRIQNVPPFADDFEEWLYQHIPDVKIERSYKRVRSHGGYGNRGGWFDSPAKIELTFPSESAELYFRMKWNLVEL